ncbi:diphthine synthase [Candidatus Woesearchaeota archaeon]|nr:diphthine synthase [Candidatus Woesearchaeota archaeon]
MTLYLIGIGLCDEKDISVKGLEIVKNARAVYVEQYTNVLQVGVDRLETLYGRKVEIAAREDIEKRGGEIIASARDTDVAILIVGDVFSATTHSDLYLRARQAGVAVHVVHNASVMTAIGATGLSLYKFGKTASVPFYSSEHPVDTPYTILSENLLLGMHTLMLLDLDPKTRRFMTISEAIVELRRMEERKENHIIRDNTLVVGCARLGCPDSRIAFGTLSEIEKIDFGKPPSCLIIPGQMHFMEEDVLRTFNREL